MRLDIAGFIFLVVLFVLMPRGALRSARHLRQAQAGTGPMPSRARVAGSALFALLMLWVISFLNADGMGRSLFALPAIGAREIGIGLIGLVVLLGAIPVARAIRTPEEERRALLQGFVPRGAREYAVFALIAVMAGIAEEAAYRGVAVWILSPIMGGLVPAAFLSSMAFAVAHAVQGGKAMVVVFGIAVVCHALVYLTNTLVIAMVVHTVYDLIAGAVAARRADALRAEDAARAAVAGAGAPAATVAAGAPATPAAES
jgi:hypothetical protein